MLHFLLYSSSSPFSLYFPGLSACSLIYSIFSPYLSHCLSPPPHLPPSPLNRLLSKEHSLPRLLCVRNLPSHPSDQTQNLYNRSDSQPFRGTRSCSSSSSLEKICHVSVAAVQRNSVMF
jgi:hypothetical protein